MPPDREEGERHDGMRARIAGFDWAQTPLGPRAQWPVSLRTIVEVMLHSRQPMFLWWGPDLIQLYNDAYVPSFGRGKHPGALGQRGVDCWQEIWPIIWPQIDDVMQRARASWNQDGLVPIFRNGRIEEVYWTYGYSPVFDEAGAVAGTLVICTETTARVVAERRLRALRRVADGTAAADDPAALIACALDALGAPSPDVAFALAYDADAQGGRRLLGTTGLEPADAAALDAALRPHLATPGLLPAEDLGALGLRLPGGPAPEPAHALWIAPAGAPGADDRLVFGLSPRLPFDDGYRDFLGQVSDQVVAARGRIAGWRSRDMLQSEVDNLLEQAPIAAAVLVGPDHVFRLANPLFCRIVGRDVVGRPYREAIPDGVGTPLVDVLDRVYRLGEPFVTEEALVALDRDGTSVVEDGYFRFNLEPTRDATGAVRGVMATAADITSQVRARHALERAHADREVLLVELQSASRAKDEFLAMLGHELRNPLAPIVTAIELMKLRGNASGGELSLVERQLQQLVRLVDDLLDVARITRGLVVLARAPIELAAVVAYAIESASPLLEIARHRLVVDVPETGLVVEADLARLAQVVANLLTNAAKYTPDEGTITVSARRDGGDVVLTVRDTGVGIDAEMMPHLFKAFSQAPQDLARSRGGLGLGLAIVDNLTRLHGGTVTASSPGRGQGSEFTVALPAARAAAAAPAGAPVITAGPATPCRVLLVDDNDDAAWILSEALSRRGYQVTTAHDGPTALRLARAAPPEIAVLDIGLPVMDGYELATHFRGEARLAGCRLIAMTGYGQPGDRQRSAAAGFDLHLVKPISLDQLIAAFAARDA